MSAGLEIPLSQDGLDQRELFFLLSLFFFFSPPILHFFSLWAIVGGYWWLVQVEKQLSEPQRRRVFFFGLSASPFWDRVGLGNRGENYTQRTSMGASYWCLTAWVLFLDFRKSNVIFHASYINLYELSHSNNLHFYKNPMREVPFLSPLQIWGDGGIQKLDSLSEVVQFVVTTGGQIQIQATRSRDCSLYCFTNLEGPVLQVSYSISISLLKLKCSVSWSLNFFRKNNQKGRKQLK